MPFLCGQTGFPSKVVQMRDDAVDEVSESWVCTLRIDQVHVVGDVIGGEVLQGWECGIHLVGWLVGLVRLEVRSYLIVENMRLNRLTSVRILLARGPTWRETHMVAQCGEDEAIQVARCGVFDRHCGKDYLE